MITVEEAYKLRRIIEEAMASVSDETALEAVTLFPSWKVDTEYVVGDRVLYKGILYKVLQNHTSQADWTPDAAPSLFAEVLIPISGVIPEWVQPDSTNPYMIGDKVTHNGKTYESLVDNNVWEPGVTGTESLWAVVE